MYKDFSARRSRKKKYSKIVKTLKQYQMPPAGLGSLSSPFRHTGLHPAAPGGDQPSIRGFPEGSDLSLRNRLWSLGCKQGGDPRIWVVAHHWISLKIPPPLLPMAPKQGGGYFLVMDFSSLDFLRCSITRGGVILKDIQ